MFPDQPLTVLPYASGDISYNFIARSAKVSASEQSKSSCGGGGDMESRIARLESDVSYIKRDIGEIKTDVKSIDSRLSTIETGVKVIKATGIVITLAFGLCAWLFGSYASQVLNAVNALVLKQ